MKQSRSIKQLNDRLFILQSEIEVISKDIDNLIAVRKRKQTEITAIKGRINKLKCKIGVSVSDHALVRYMERVKCVDIHSAKEAILNEKTLLLIEQMGPNGTYPCDGFSIVVKNNVVVTVIV